jgi:hypothetical protein
LTVTSGEFVVYRGLRALPTDLPKTWPTERRERYLIRTDVALPVSLDRSVLPAADERVVSAFDIVATVVPTVGSKEAVARWRGSELYERLPESPEWQCLGHDICDEAGKSGLMNCAYADGERYLVDDFAPCITRHHLFRTAEDADRFREVCDRRVAEHAPFVVVAIYARTSQIELLNPSEQ